MGVINSGKQQYAKQVGLYHRTDTPDGYGFLCLNGLYGNTQHFGNLLVGKMAVPAEQEYFLAPGGQRTDSMVNEALQII